MQAQNIELGTVLKDDKMQRTIFKISKRIAKMITKKYYKEVYSKKSYSVFYKGSQHICVPIKHSYDGHFLKFTFFDESFIPEVVWITVNELNDLFENICKNMEIIFSKMPVNIHNLEFKILPGECPGSESIIMFTCTFHIFYE